jgi:hypothetical protein
MFDMAEVKQIDDNTKEEIEEKSWADDIENNDYYYDDSHGYEVYVDDEDEATQSDLLT